MTLDVELGVNSAAESCNCGRYMFFFIGTKPAFSMSLWCWRPLQHQKRSSTASIRIAFSTTTAFAICPAVMPSLSSSVSASSAKVVPGVADDVVEGAFVDGAAGDLIAAGETALIVKLFVFEARFDSFVSGVALRVRVIDGAMASSGTSPERKNVFGLNESHVVSGTMDIQTSPLA